MPNQQGLFFIDWLGFLWHGPLARGEYKRLEGVDASTMKILWATRDIGDAMPVDVCSFQRAQLAVNLHVKDARERKRK